MFCFICTGLSGFCSLFCVRFLILFHFFLECSILFAEKFSRRSTLSRDGLAKFPIDYILLEEGIGEFFLLKMFSPLFFSSAIETMLLFFWELYKLRVETHGPNFYPKALSSDSSNPKYIGLMGWFLEYLSECLNCFNLKDFCVALLLGDPLYYLIELFIDQNNKASK